jgi:hypothetical protein
LVGYEDNPPRTDAMVNSLRSMGYDLSMAIADLVDNSITAKASNVFIDYGWRGSRSWVRISDDGVGMSEERLKEAMRLGSNDPAEMRDPEDLGRFGMGLKTASFSQCRLMVVGTKNVDGKISMRFWDLDHLIETNRWEMGIEPDEDQKHLLEPLRIVEHGTVVLWTRMDRIIQDDAETDDEKAGSFFLKRFLEVRSYLEMVFHRYLVPPHNLKIRIGTELLKPWDPFLLSNTYTQRLASERYEDGTVAVNPYVLPHVSHRPGNETERGAGPRGWNAQQGFYVYRNDRMIISGGYLDLGLKQEEHYKLARISVDLKNLDDREWAIDIRKTSIVPPDRLRSEMGRIARATREKAMKVYRARTGSPRKSSGEMEIHEVWLRRRMGDKIIYTINRDNEVIARISSEIKPPRAWINKLFQVIETSLPHRRIIMDNAELEDCHVGLPPEIWTPSPELVTVCKELYHGYRSEGKNHETAVSIVMSFEPFNNHPMFRATLDSLMEKVIL